MLGLSNSIYAINIDVTEVDRVIDIGMSDTGNQPPMLTITPDLSDSDSLPDRLPDRLPDVFAQWFANKGWHLHSHQRAMLDADSHGQSCLLVAPTGDRKSVV